MGTFKSNLMHKMEETLQSVNTVLPAKVLEYSSFEARVIPLFKVWDDESGKAVEDVDYTCPVIFPLSSEFCFHHELKKDDPVLMLCSSQSIESWYDSDGVISVSSKSRKDFSLNNAFVIPGGVTQKSLDTMSWKEDILSQGTSLVFKDQDKLKRVLISDGMFQFESVDNKLFLGESEDKKGFHVEVTDGSCSIANQKGDELFSNISSLVQSFKDLLLALQGQVGTPGAVYNGMMDSPSFVEAVSNISSELVVVETSINALKDGA